MFEKYLVPEVRHRCSWRGSPKQSDAAHRVRRGDEAKDGDGVLMGQPALSLGEFLYYFGRLGFFKHTLSQQSSKSSGKL